MLDAVPNHVVCDAPQRLLGVVVVAAQLTRTIPQHLKAAFNF
jgi:hypothetical protein